MNRKVQSFIVILITIFCSSIMLFPDEIGDKANLVRNKILVIGKNNNIYNKNSNLQKQSKSKEKSDDKQKNDSLNKDLKAQEYNDTKANSSNLSVMTDKYKDSKMDRIGGEIEKDKEKFFSQDDSKNNIDNKSLNSKSKERNLQEDDKKTNNNSSVEDVPVFKVSKSQIKDSLTVSDRAKLLAIASKLSAVDYEKVNKYLESGSDEDAKNTIKLLKERLSDKDYDKVKEVAKKFINMDVVEQ